MCDLEDESLQRLIHANDGQEPLTCNVSSHGTSLFSITAVIAFSLSHAFVTAAIIRMVRAGHVRDAKKENSSNHQSKVGPHAVADRK